MGEKMSYVRDLGLQEWYLRERTVTKMYNHFSVSCRFNHPISHGLLFAVLRSLILEHPTLACNVSNISKEGRVEMHLIKNLKFSDVVIHNDSFDRVSSEVLKFMDTNIKFDPTNPDLPLFKLLALKGQKDFVLILDHSLFDGESGTNFWKLFYTKLTEIDSEENTPDEVDSKTASLFDIDDDLPLIKDKKFSPRAEDIYSIQPDLMFKLSKAIKPYLPTYLHGYLKDGDHARSPDGYSQWHGTTVPNFDQFKSFQFRIVNVKPEIINQVLKKCRAEKVALSSYVNACLLNSFVNNGNPVGLDLEKHFVRLPNPIGCRRYVTEDNKKDFDCNFGNMFFLGAASHIPAKHLKSFSWDEVRNMDVSLKNAVNDKSMLMNLGWSMRNVKTLDDMDKHAVSPMANFRTDSLRQSNLGFVKFASDKANDAASKWEVENMVFVQNPNAGTYIILNSISTLKGGMNIGVSYIDDGSIEDIPKVLDIFEENILHFFRELA